MGGLYLHNASHFTLDKSFKFKYYEHAWKESVFGVIRTEYGDLSVFSPNAEKYGKNADQNNSDGLFLRSVLWQ